MSKLVKIGTWLAVNPDHVASVRRTAEGSYIEMTTGTRHATNATVAHVTRKLNGEPDENTY